MRLWNQKMVGLALPPAPHEQDMKGQLIQNIVGQFSSESNVNMFMNVSLGVCFASTLEQDQLGHYRCVPQLLKCSASLHLLSYHN